jgi:FAD dependent oxidoreductase TIGR03364
MTVEKIKTDIAVVGSGIVGLAIAYAWAQRGKKVTIVERNDKALGASIRNFGMIWPIGQPKGPLLDRALFGRKTWLELAEQAGIWISETGSLHLAYREDEWRVLQEFMENIGEGGYDCQLLGAEEVSSYSSYVKTDGLIGALWSSTELLVDPRQALSRIPKYLADRFNVQFLYNRAALDVSPPVLHTSREEVEAEQIYICNGADFETLYPEVFHNAGLIKSKLQMMRTRSQLKNNRLGPSLCGGLTLRHYTSFAHCPTLPALSDRFDRENPNFKKWGIHVMIAQNCLGELIIGDSHEYGQSFDPFIREEINGEILRYLFQFTNIPDFKLAERWYGVYAKHPERTELIERPAPGVTIVNGLGGAGMTLSFGLAEEVVEGLFP